MMLLSAQMLATLIHNRDHIHIRPACRVVISGLVIMGMLRTLANVIVRDMFIILLGMLILAGSFWSC